MPIKQVVINASPLIILFASRQENHLPELFDKIYVPMLYGMKLFFQEKEI